MRLLFAFLLTTLLRLPALAQSAGATAADDYLPWSAIRRLTAADFRMALRANTNLRGSNAVFHLAMEGNAYDLLGKRGNAVVRNDMFCSASWLDTTEVSQAAQSIRFQQTLFDIQEVYARRLRQQARSSAWKIILVGKPDLKELYAKFVRDIQLRQVSYTEQTAYGTIAPAQRTWENQIQHELLELQTFQLAN